MIHLRHSILGGTLLHEVLDARAERSPDREVYTFLRDGEVESGALGFAALRRRALVVAERLRSLDAPGERAVLMYPQGIEFPVAFFGCLYAGTIAVPVSVPGRRKTIDILRRIVADCGARWILSTGPLLAQLSQELATDPALGRVSCLDPESRPEGLSQGGARSPVDRGRLALIQYTSGSTGWSRGVGVTHANLAANQRQIESALGKTENAIEVSWLPMFHDMGLGTLLQAVWVGGRCILISPQAFLQDPLRWLRAISKYKATVNGGPDFAYDLCARRTRPGSAENLDLTSWRHAYNGSEPVRAATIERFADAFRDYGFRREAFYPVYGLAEATLFVTGGDCEKAPVVETFSATDLQSGTATPARQGGAGRTLVGCGHAWPGTEVLTVRPDTRERVAAETIGEIWIGGECVASGYWGNDAETTSTFQAFTANGDGPFLRTGDLGFFHEGNLFVTGRCKDLIIVRGRNHYPQDIEASVSAAHPALVPHGCAAFSIDRSDAELLVVVQEVARSALRTLDAAEVFRAIRRAVSEEHGLQVHAVVLVRPSTLPKTSSGKVRRRSCRNAFLDQSLLSVASSVLPTPSPATDEVNPNGPRGAEASARAERLIQWVRRHAGDLVTMHTAEASSWTVPMPLLRDLGRQGLLGMQVDPQFGGLGLGYSDMARVLQELAMVDFALALFVGRNEQLGIQPVAKYARPEVKALLLPALVQGAEFAAFAFREPGGVQPPRGLTAKAVPDGEDRWQLLGTKYLEGAQQGSQIFNIFVQHDEPPGMSAFVVCAGVEGLRSLEDGLAAGVFGWTRKTIVLDGVGVGRDSLLGPLGSGMSTAHEATTRAGLAGAAACVGGMKLCAQTIGRAAAVYSGHTRDGRLTPNPMTLARLGSIAARISALECLVARTAQGIDAGHPVCPEAFAACRILGPDLLLRAIDDVAQLGLRAVNPAAAHRVMCLYRDAGLLRYIDGLPEAIAEHTGAEMMESDASLRVLVSDVYGAPDAVRWIGPVLEGVRARMANLRGPLAKRAQRWGHTRAGELTAWLVLLAAVEGSVRSSSSTELQRARAWAVAQLEDALSSVRLGTPSETAVLDTSDVASTFADYLRDAPPGERVDGEAAARELRSWVVSWLAGRLRIPVSQIESGRSFADHGLDSVASVELAKALTDKLGCDLEETLLWNFPTIDALVEQLARRGPAGEIRRPAAAQAASPSSSPFGVEAQLDEDIARLEQKLSSQV